MRPTTKIGDSHEEEMNLILEFILNFDVNRLLYAINGKQLRTEDIVEMTMDIQEYYGKLCRQKEFLFRYGKQFNNRYTNENNKYFDITLVVTRKMSTGFTGVKKKIFKPFVKVSCKRLPDGTPNPNIMQRSMISTENYMADIYGLSSYPECVKELFLVMLQFYEIVNECIEECIRIIEEEKELRGDARRCLELLKKAIEKSTKAQAHIIEAIECDPAFRDALKNSPTLSGDKNNAMLKDFKQSSMSEKFAQKFLHNCTNADISKVTLYVVRNTAEEDPMLVLAQMAFGYEDEKIRLINYIVSHFDSLLPKQCKRGKIPAYQLYVFMEWCAGVSSTKNFIRYFNKYYKAHGGKWACIVESAVNGAKNKPLTADEEKREVYEKVKTSMLAAIEKLVKEFNSQTQPK